MLQLKATLEKQCRNGESNNENREEILQIIGGIDVVLNALIENNLLINEKHANKICKIITKGNKQLSTLPTSISNNNSIQSREDGGLKQDWTYTFCDKSTFLFSIFGTTNTMKILNILNSKITKVYLSVILIVALSFFMCYFRTESTIFYYLFITSSVIQTVSYILYLLVWILHSNIIAVKLSIGFQLFFKIYYALYYCVAIILHQIFFKPEYIPFMTTYSIFVVLLVILVLIFDAVNVSKEWKFIISSIMAALFTFQAAEATHNGYTKGFEKSYIYLTDRFKFSTVEMQSEAAKVLSLFLWKQAISSLLQPNKCILIRYVPLVKWDVDKNKTNSTHSTRIWRRICIGYFVFYFILHVLYFIMQYFQQYNISSKADNPPLLLFWIRNPFYIIIAIFCVCCIIKGTYKSMKIVVVCSVIMIVESCITYMIAENSDIIINSTAFIFAAIYTMKVRDTSNIMDNDILSENGNDRNETQNKFDEFPQSKLGKNIHTEIQMNKVKVSKNDDNIDNEESVSHISESN